MNYICAGVSGAVSVPIQGVCVNFRAQSKFRIPEAVDPNLWSKGTVSLVAPGKQSLGYQILRETTEITHILHFLRIKFVVLSYYKVCQISTRNFPKLSQFSPHRALPPSTHRKYLTHKQISWKRSKVHYFSTHIQNLYLRICPKNSSK